MATRSFCNHFTSLTYSVNTVYTNIEFARLNNIILLLHYEGPVKGANFRPQKHQQANFYIVNSVVYKGNSNNK